MKNTTLNDVAAHAGVSYQTVSRVVNNHPNVAQKTRARVMDSIQALNYRPNQAARSLVTRRSHTIAIISFGTTLYGPIQMVSNITRQAKANGYHVIVSAVENLGREEIEETLYDIQSQLIDGIIMIAPLISDDLPDINALVGNTPLVQVDREHQPGVASIMIEQAHGTQLVTLHLIDLGHQCIAEISGPLHWHGAVMRHNSWLTTMQNHDLETHLTTQGDWSARSGYDATRRLLSMGEPIHSGCGCQRSNGVGRDCGLIGGRFTCAG